MIKSIGSRLALVAILIILLVPLVVFGVLGTESGTDWLIRQILRTENLGASVGKVEGTLLDRLVLTNVLYRSETEQVALDTFSFDWNALALLTGTLHVRTISATHMFVEKLGEPETPETATEFSVPAIPLKIQLDHLELLKLRYKDKETETLVERLQLAAELENRNARLTLLELEMPALNLQGHGDVQLDRELPMNARINWQLRLPDTPEINGQTTLVGDLDQLILTGAVGGAVILDHTLTLRLREAQPVFALTGNWRKLQWPLSGPPRFSSQEGYIELSGTADDYRIELNSKLTTDQFAPFDLNLKGNGDTESLNIAELTVMPKHGRLDLSGRVAWANAVVFDLKIAADRIDPGDFIQQLPGSLNLKAEASGRVIDERISGKIAIERLDGKLRGYPVDARGKLTVDGEQVHLDKVRVRSAKNQLTADGVLGLDKAQLQFKLDAPDLATVWPGLAGSVKGYGSIKGSYLNPVVIAKLTGERLSFQEYAVHRVELAIDYAQALNKSSKISLLGQRLQVAGQTVDRLSLEGSGSRDNHRFQSQIHSAEVKLDLDIVGRLRNNQWDGVINQFALNHRQLHNWQLAQPWPVHIRRQRNDFVIELPKDCLIQHETSVCLSLLGSVNGQMQADAEIRGLELTQLQPWLPETVSLEGALSADAQAFKQGETLTARMQLHIPEPQAKLTRPNQEALIIPLSETRLDAAYAPGRARIDLRMGLGKQDYINANIEADLEPKGLSPTLSGSIRVSVADMTFVDAWVPEIERVKGRFSADLYVSGDVEHPVVSGISRLSEAGMAVPRAGIVIKDMNLQITNDALQSERLLVTGQANSGKGKLTVNGTIDLAEEQGFPVLIQVEGNDFQIAKLPETEIAISPQLQIRQQRDRTKVSGNVAVDQATLKITETPESATAPSEDEVIVGVDDSAPVRKVAPPVQTDITIDMGEQFHFSGYGLSTRLTGKLRYTGADGKQRMQGRVAMKDAKYKAYGQDLTLTKGEFLFNGPTDNPWLNIEATRQAAGEDVTAILRVTGPLKSPESKVSTEPPLPESEALAYLLTGRSLQRVSESQSNTLAKAAFSYGAGQLSWLSDQMGLDEFEVEESERLEDTAVRLGKYINPDFYIGLSLGFFSNNYAVLFKKQLNEYFSLQTRAGETQRIELKYQLDTD